MKVFNYLQFANTASYDENNFLSNANEFYSQPFKPEMITELFEGWKEVSVKNDINTVFKDDKDEICFWQDEKYYNIRFLAVTNPETLDDFIRDCQRAGIELIWKEKK
ncbi:MAG: hypothetical protein NT007_09810 [Candidatus Kapabacteria bacterium]|nr:hypothetical protein [Candidatus Kapabacteria bacterium]